MVLKQNTFKYPYPFSIKNDEILIIDIQMVYNTIFVQHKCIPQATYTAAQGKGTLQCVVKVGENHHMLHIWTPSMWKCKLIVYRKL